MTKTGKDYFGWNRILSIILAIFPVTALILGIATRLTEGKIVAALLRLILGWNIIWLIDIVLMILNGRIMRLLNI